MTEIAQQAAAIGSSSAKYQGCYLAFSWQPEELPDWLRETGEEEVRCINFCLYCADETCALSKDIS